MSVMESIGEKENVMKNDKLATTTRMIASVFAATVLMFGVGSTYADGTCDALCEDGTFQQTIEPDIWTCEGVCDAFCVPYWSNLKDCSYKDENIKGDCSGECRDGTSFNNWSYTEANCHDQCDAFCGTNEDVAACYFKNQNIKGAIPTVSEWGVVIMALLLLIGAKVYFNRRRAMQT